MKNTVVAITEQELDELAACKELQEGYGRDTAEELRSDLADSFIAKFPDYITDGPGYAGPLIVIATGIMSTVFVARERGRFIVHWPTE